MRYEPWDPSIDYGKRFPVPGVIIMPCPNCGVDVESGDDDLSYPRDGCIESIGFLHECTDKETIWHVKARFEVRLVPIPDTTEVE